MKPEIPVTELRELFTHDTSTGQLWWKSRPREAFSSNRAWNAFNTRFSGKLAFTYVDTNGYYVGTLYGVNYFAHRILWALHYGVWPTQTIDHINGNPSDNSISNLREVSHAENLKNQKIAANNTSGVIGVLWHRRDQKWYAQIKVAKKRIFLGYFGSIADAIIARRDAEVLYGFHKNHGAR